MMHSEPYQCFDYHAWPEKTISSYDNNEKWKAFSVGQSLTRKKELQSVPQLPVVARQWLKNPLND
jgi:hypothetical protein